MKKQFYFFTLLLFPYFIEAQNVGIGTATPVTKLNVIAAGSTPAIPGATSTAIFRIGVGTAEGVDFGKMVTPPYSGWMQSGLNGAVPDPLSLQPLGGNVGIGTISPAEKLDVTGSINVTGTIKANGADGTANQVLMKNSTGNLAWGDMCEYKNFVSLVSSAGGTWTVPADVTKILVEVWGAGGGGNLLAGGGGGGYIKAHFTVLPGAMVTYDVGTFSTGSGTSTAVSGEMSTCIVGSVTLTAGGGQGALYLAATNGQAGVGGNGSISGSFINYILLQGATGESQKRNYFQYNATTYYENGEAGKGGDAANSNNTGSLGQTYLYNTTGAALIFRNGNSSSGKRPGGGGSSGIEYGATTLFGGNGAPGLIIIHY